MASILRTKIYISSTALLATSLLGCASRPALVEWGPQTFKVSAPAVQGESGPAWRQLYAMAQDHCLVENRVAIALEERGPEEEAARKDWSLLFRCAGQSSR